MSLPRVGDLVLRNSSQDGVPDIVDGWEVERQAGDSDRQRWEELLGELTERHTQSRRGQECRRGDPGKKGRGDGSHFDGFEYVC